MASLLVLTNLLLATLTGTYVWLSLRNLRQLQQDNHYYRSIVDKQLQLTTLPHLYWDLRENEQSALVMDLFNISGIPAYDIHLSMIGAYTETSLDITTFLRTHVQPRYRKSPLPTDKVGYYGIRNSVRLSLLPAQQTITVTLPFPTTPIDIYTLVQYRDLAGDNYYQLCCFSGMDAGEYRANGLEPKSADLIERLHLFEPDGYTLAEMHVSYYLRDFVDLWNHSISSRLLMTSVEPQRHEQYS
ncbi:MAG: hypothetical protein F6K65_40330 [Moorea sp. SIO3C2]|nr:hypothetical protein [Moorena sp. SIO3C2]